MSRRHGRVSLVCVREHRALRSLSTRKAPKHLERRRHTPPFQNPYDVIECRVLKKKKSKHDIEPMKWEDACARYSGSHISLTDASRPTVVALSVAFWSLITTDGPDEMRLGQSSGRRDHQLGRFSFRMPKDAPKNEALRSD